MYKSFKKFVYRTLTPLIKLYKFLHWRLYLLIAAEIKIVVGAGPTKYNGWFSTDIVTLDVTKESDFRKYFSKKKINKVLAEHVLEHLSDQELEKMIINFYKYSDEKVNIRISVPDGFHNNQKYLDSVKPGGTGDGADDHKNLFNVKSLSVLFEKYGFIANPVEFWDEGRNFHGGYKNDEFGYVKRSFDNDKRNSDGQPNYTSLIIDFKKSK